MPGSGVALGLMAPTNIGGAVISRLAKAMEGPAYTAVGLGVIGFQRAQVYRHELQKEMASRSAPVRQAVSDVAGDALQHLPEPARQLVDAMGNLVVELPGEARAICKEALALGRFALQAAGAPASRYTNR